MELHAPRAGVLHLSDPLLNEIKSVCPGLRDRPGTFRRRGDGLSMVRFHFKGWDESPDKSDLLDDLQANFIALIRVLRRVPTRSRSMTRRRSGGI